MVRERVCGACGCVCERAREREQAESASWARVCVKERKIRCETLCKFHVLLCAGEREGIELGLSSRIK